MSARILLVAVTLALPAAVQAQAVRLSVSAIGGPAGSALVVAGAGEDGSGTWIGGRVDLRVGPFAFEGTGIRGTLSAGTGPTFERDGGDMRLVAGVRVLPALAIEGSYAMRAFDSPAGYQEWTVTGGGVRLASALGTPAVEGFVRLHYLASVDVTGAGKPDQAVGVEAGFELAPRRSPIFVGAFYRLERFDFTAASPRRSEHFDMLGIRIGLQLLR